MILSYDIGDEKIILFFALLGNSIPHLVHLSGQRRMTFRMLCNGTEQKSSELDIEGV